jgi:hypothetical protein
MSAPVHIRPRLLSALVYSFYVQADISSSDNNPAEAVVEQQEDNNIGGPYEIAAGR